MGTRPEDHRDPTRELDPGEVEVLAETMSLFATASRLRLLFALLNGEHSVEDLAAITGLSPNLASQQLRTLRTARLVSVRRAGRRSFYALHDHHIADLLAAMRHHSEHLER